NGSTSNGVHPVRQNQTPHRADCTAVTMPSYHQPKAIITDVEQSNKLPNSSCFTPEAKPYVKKSCSNANPRMDVWEKLMKQLGSSVPPPPEQEPLQSYHTRESIT